MIDRAPLRRGSLLVKAQRSACAPPPALVRGLLLELLEVEAELGRERGHVLPVRHQPARPPNARPSTSVTRYHLGELPLGEAPDYSAEWQTASTLCPSRSITYPP